MNIVSAELGEYATNLEDYKFDFTKPLCIVLGHEETGVPADILYNSDRVFIEMTGVGYCLNTSQAGNIMLYEAIKQYKKFDIFSTLS